MNTATGNILTINGGSSSIKFAVFTPGPDRPERGLHGQISRIGQADRTQPGTSLLISDPEAPTMSAEPTPVPAADFASVVDWLVDWLGKQPVFGSVRVVGHRVVHGLAHTEPEPITAALLTELRGISAYDPDHLPGEIALIEAFRHRYPDLQQVACFDTAFHRTMPRVAQLLPIPRRFDGAGVRRYGFHGLSYSFLLDELGRIVEKKTANGRVILAHLGSGASLCAVQNGQSVDTTMGFTPTGGLMMGTRPGDLDPGVAWFLMQSEKLSAGQFSDLMNHQSGLLGLSETGSDMQDLLDIQATDSRAAEAIDLFCYQVKKGIGAYTAVLDGLDTLVFSGGIGQHAPAVRARICTGLTYLGIEIDDQRNTANAPIISTDTSRVTVRVIPTDEEQMMARLVGAMKTT
jgi:acetate kinase